MRKESTGTFGFEEAGRCARPQIDFQQILLLPIQVDTTEERTHGPFCTASTGRCITDSTIKYSKAGIYHIIFSSFKIV